MTTALQNLKSRMTFLTANVNRNSTKHIFVWSISDPAIWTDSYDTSMTTKYHRKSTWPSQNKNWRWEMTLARNWPHIHVNFSNCHIMQNNYRLVNFNSNHEVMAHFEHSTPKNMSRPQVRIILQSYVHIPKTKQKNRIPPQYQIPKQPPCTKTVLPQTQFSPSLAASNKQLKKNES